jgi:DNA-binding NarL/FixJ family response regulator
MERKRPRVLLADNQVSLLVAYRKLLYEEFEIVGTSADGPALMATAIKLKPDVIVVDLALASLSEISAGRELQRLIPKTKFLAITNKEDLDAALEALREWASGVLLKRTAGKELLCALRELVAGRSYAPATITRRLKAIEKGSSTTYNHKFLTRRQREVLQLLAQGRTMKDTADFLGLTTRTVAFHKYRIMKNFGLRNDVDLLRLAIREHLASAQ